MESHTEWLYKMDSGKVSLRYMGKRDENGISILDKILHKLVEAERKENGREEKTTMIIVDSKTIQNADTAEVKGYDAGKKSLE